MYMLHTSNFKSKNIFIMGQKEYMKLLSMNRYIVDDKVVEDWSKQMVRNTARLVRKTARNEDREQSHGALPKNLIHTLSYNTIKEICSGDMLFHSPVHTGGLDGVDFKSAASRERWKNLTCFCGSCARVYIELLGKALLEAQSR
jgi:hypothetical protein